MRTKPLILTVSLAFVVLAAITATFVVLLSRPTGPIARANLPDGRTLQIEGVTFGTQHHIGKRSIVEPLQPWLPSRVIQFFEPKYPYSSLSLEEPGLVVWVNAIDPATGKQVDCQSIQMEFVGAQGELFGQETSSWSGGSGFWRAGHVFHAFPRTRLILTLQISCWRKPGSTVRVELPNPCVTTPINWEAHPLPQRLRVGDLEVELTQLTMRTNGGFTQVWQTPARYWEPEFVLRRNGEEVTGWTGPEWTGADPTGNRGKFLGTHQPVLRFSAEFYPSATNLQDSILLGRLPVVTVRNLQTNAWEDVILTNSSARLTVLGFCASGVHVFTGGRFETNPAIRLGATRGGAPSGWVGQSQRVSPVQIKHWHGHYTPVPAVYIHAPGIGPKERVGLRLRDEQGGYWLARPEPQGDADGVWPFLVELPLEVQNISGEVVLLKPIQAEFTVQTGTGL
jgi:hypothetical protein